MDTYNQVTKIKETKLGQKGKMCYALRDLVSFLQFIKREKRSCMSHTFSKSWSLQRY